jgi:hypothetical protein
VFCLTFTLYIWVLHTEKVRHSLRVSIPLSPRTRPHDPQTVSPELCSSTRFGGLFDIIRMRITSNVKGMHASYLLTIWADKRHVKVFAPLFLLLGQGRFIDLARTELAAVRCKRHRIFGVSSGDHGLYSAFQLKERTSSTWETALWINTVS